MKDIQLEMESISNNITNIVMATEPCMPYIIS